MSGSRTKVIQSDDGKAWGVEQNGAVLYDPNMTKQVAKAIVVMERSPHPPKDWRETLERLHSQGITKVNA